MKILNCCNHIGERTNDRHLVDLLLIVGWFWLCASNLSVGSKLDTRFALSVTFKA